MNVIYADKRIAVVIKPPGVISTDEPGGMPDLLRQELGTDCIRTVHRLDAPASGLMVFARSSKAASLLSQQVRQRQIRKEYLAVVHGAPADRGELFDLLGRHLACRLTYVADAPGKGILPARLTYQVRDRCEGYSLISICLETGRTHQIRVQFSSRGWPLVGDRRYGGYEGDLPLALWSSRLAFTHPESGQPLDFRAPPPDAEPWTWFSPVEP